MSRICLVGAGSISRVHAQAVATLAGHAVSCVVDPNVAAAQRRAREVSPGAAAFRSVTEALAADAFDRAHVLVPPPLHEAVAAALLAAGKPVLLEKPMADTGAGCERLTALAAGRGVPLGVNQNFVHHPAFVRLRTLVESGGLGRPNFVGCVYNIPLRQMAARQFGHWMFREPVNILLEQAVHPLSQIAILAGSIGEVRGAAGPAMELGGAAFHPSLTAALTGAKLPASLRFAVGQNFPFWQVSVICDDGVAVADILANRLLRYRRTRYVEMSDAALSGLSSAGGLARDSVANAAGAALSLLRLRPSSDPFFRSMQASIAGFHAAVDAAGTPPLDGRFGGSLVAACERLASVAFAARPSSAPAAPAVRTQAACDVAVLGGTGFIGTHVVARLLAAGCRVSVMARTVRDLPAPFDHQDVVLHRGDIGEADSVRQAIGNAPVVVNLAHGGGGQTWEQIRDAMVGGAETVARACLGLGTRRLLHIGSIASLYLGPQPAAVTGATPPDPQPGRRADYARAKILCDRMLLGLHATDALNVCILRPGLVVGQGGSPFHTGVGFYNAEQHCIGWNEGSNPLPFVLAQDVAEAILLACAAPHLEGRCYNLVGDVRLSAREYIAELARALGRPLKFHPQSPRYLWFEDAGKWALKRVAGRPGAVPSLRDLLSRGLKARFDCSDVSGALAWQPVAERDRFIRDAILVHAAA